LPGNGLCFRSPLKQGILFFPDILSPGAVRYIEADKLVSSINDALNLSVSYTEDFKEDMMSGERNMYLDLFGIGLMLPMFFENYAGRIILTTFVLVSAIKLFEVVMSDYY